MAALAAARHDFAGALRVGRAGPSRRTLRRQRLRGDRRRPARARQLRTRPSTPSRRWWTRARPQLVRPRLLRPRAPGRCPRRPAGDAGRARGRRARRRTGRGPASSSASSVQPRRRRTAAARYRHGMQLDPTYVPPLAGLAKVAVGRGTSMGPSRASPGPPPLPLARVRDHARRPPDGGGRRARPSGSTPSCAREARLFRADGVNVDLELALFDADHGDPSCGARAARAEWGRRHSIHVADAYAWALHANGRDGEAAPLRAASRCASARVARSFAVPRRV